MTKSNFIYFYILSVAFLLVIKLESAFGEQPALEVFLDFPKTIDDAVQKLNKGFGKLCEKMSHSYNPEKMQTEIRTCLTPVFDKFKQQTWEIFFSSKFEGYVLEKFPGNKSLMIEESYDLPVNLTKTLKVLLEGNCSTLTQMEKCFNPEEYTSTQYCLDETGVAVIPFRYLKQVQKALCKDQGQPIIDLIISGVLKECRDDYYKSVYDCLWTGTKNVPPPMGDIISSNHHNSTLFCQEALKIHQCFYRSVDVCVKYNSHTKTEFKRIFKKVDDWAWFECEFQPGIGIRNEGTGIRNEGTGLFQMGPSAVLYYGLILLVLGIFKLNY